MRTTSLRLEEEEMYVSPPIHTLDFCISHGDMGSSLNQKDGNSRRNKILPWWLPQGFFKL